MKLFYAPTSPYVRKVTITAEVTGLAERIERIPAAPHPIDRDPGITAVNPLGKAPTLVTEDGAVLYDSRVIVEYLDAHSVGGRVVPASGAARWRVLTRQALGDGILDAGLLLRYEGLLRPPEQQSPAWRHGQTEKILAALEVADRQALADDLALDIGNIAIGAALGFLDFRLPELDWRTARPALTDWFAAFDAQPVVAAARPALPVTA